MPIWVVSTSLELKDISVNIGNSAIIRGVSLALEEGEFVSLLGSNGAGKTTLFKAIAGVLKPCEGTLEFKGKQITRMSADKRVKQGLVLCPEGRHLFPRLSVRKNLMLGAYVRRRDHKGIERSLGQVHDMFPILEEREKQMAGTLSGGEQQMLVIARALMSAPKLLLLDEPSLGLAPLIVHKIADTARAVNEMGTTVFLSEQNANMALGISDRGYVLENGSLVLQGPSSQLIEDDTVRSAYLGV